MPAWRSWRSAPSQLIRKQKRRKQPAADKPNLAALGTYDVVATPKRKSRKKTDNYHTVCWLIGSLFFGYILQIMFLQEETPLLIPRMPTGLSVEHNAQLPQLSPARWRPRHIEKLLNSEGYEAQIVSKIDNTSISLRIGDVGMAVQKARSKRFLNRMQGAPRTLWNHLNREMVGCNSSEISDDLRSRLPHAVLIGVQKGGTTALYKYLDQHQDIIRSTKEIYFLDDWIDKNITMAVQRKIRSKNRRERQKMKPKQQLRRRLKADMQRNYSSGNRRLKTSTGFPNEDVEANVTLTISAQEIRQIYADVMVATEEREKDEPKSLFNRLVQSMSLSAPSPDSSPWFRLDATPNYLMQSDRIPDRLLCLTPWVKVLALLRDPIERAYSNYQMKLRAVANGFDSPKLMEKNELAPPKSISFDEYVRLDMEALTETGVLQDWNVIDFDDFFASDDMWHAWQAYIQNGLNAPVGMGLYAIPLLHHKRSFERHGKSWSDDFLAVQSESLRDDPAATHGRILKFLGLSKETLTTYPNVNAAGKEQDISNETRTALRNVFGPFNHKLEDILGSRWRGVWK